MSNPKNDQFLKDLNAPKPTPPAKKYSDNASYDDYDSPLPKDKNKTDWAD